MKREAEGAADAVRIMTVHGAKGLQAPVVIIPDIGGGRARRTILLWDRVDGIRPDIPLWAPRKEFQAAAFAGRAGGRRARRRARRRTACSTWR